MTRADLERVRREPLPLLLTLLLGIAAGILLTAVLGAGDASPTAADTRSAVPAHEDTGARRSVSTTPAAEQARFTAVLEQAVRAAHGYGGKAQIGIWLDGWRSPLVAGDERDRPIRMWSMSKPITALAVYKQSSGQPPPTLRAAVQDALVQSSNCAQRRVVLGLQTLTPDRASAETAFDRVLIAAGATNGKPDQLPAPPAPECVAYANEHADGIADPSAPALLFGTATWTTRDAVLFARALALEKYGKSGRSVAALMRIPKQPDRTTPNGAEQFTADPAWGAGTVFKAWKPAYKAGWGGHAQQRYVAGQVAELSVGTRKIAVAAMFHPGTQPASDDPGPTKAPEAIEAMLRPLERAFRQLETTR